MWPVFCSSGGESSEREREREREREGERESRILCYQFGGEECKHRRLVKENVSVMVNTCTREREREREREKEKDQTGSATKTLGARKQENQARLICFEE
jgi:hypothetical protein